MSKYQIVFHKAFVKYLKAIPKDYHVAIYECIKGLSTNPRPNGVKKMQASKNLYRIRCGDYRIIYSIEDSKLMVFIAKGGHRKDVYDH